MFRLTAVALCAVLASCLPAAATTLASVTPSAAPPDDELVTGNCGGAKVCQSPEPAGCFCCDNGGATFSTIPSDGAFDLTTFVNFTGQTMGCAPHDLPLNAGLTASTLESMAQSGQHVYMADAQRFGCGAHVRLTNTATGTSCVALVEDTGPNQCVELAADTPVIDASPVIVEHLFGITSAGWRDRRAVSVSVVSQDVALGCDDQAAATQNPAPSSPSPTASSAQPTCTTGLTSSKPCSELGADVNASCLQNAQGSQTCCVPTGAASKSANGATCCSGNTTLGPGSVCTAAFDVAAVQPACNLDLPGKPAPAGAMCATALAAQCQENFQGNQVCCVADGLSPSPAGATACCSNNGLSSDNVTCKPQAPIPTGAMCEGPNACIPNLTGPRRDTGEVVTSPASCQVRADGKQVCCIPDGAPVAGGVANSTVGAQLCCSYNGQPSYVLDNGAACESQPGAVSSCATAVLGAGGPSQSCPKGTTCQASLGVFSCQ